MIGMIWGQTPDRVIGRDGTMPWDVPEDMAHFTSTTKGHPVIMGRRTWESFPARFRPLPGRANIVISGSQDQRQALADAGAIAVGSMNAALDAAAASEGGEEVWVIGGAGIFESMLTKADTASVTVIDVDETGDTFAPALEDAWTLAVSDPEQGWHESRKGARYRIETWTRSHS
ncbi:dihydrofolate reductase [Arthrobacter sp. H14]|uniref:dihydrofolate reductase n=1 Tax=Arthrobacter sp. H14 TaxID=1312959 RepID=UPI000478B457|nr:dihydrofolate reductase [Arthrobacter sp. H14]